MPYHHPAGSRPPVIVSLNGICMYLSAISFILSSIAGQLAAQPSQFLAGQKKYARVSDAYKEKETVIRGRLMELNLDLNNLNILIAVYKADTLFEVYVKGIKDSVYRKLITYPVCNLSGELGPKRQQGDLQIPEGFYHIERFNPSSSFYLSLGINYPNRSDRIKKTAANAGGDIFIHGSCVTIGCIPMTDEIIKEIYIYALESRNNGQHKIPVYIFPFRMTDVNLELYRSKLRPDEGLRQFWKNLKTGYEKFINEGKELHFSIDQNGNYVF